MIIRWSWMRWVKYLFLKKTQRKVSPLTALTTAWKGQSWRFKQRHSSEGVCTSDSWESRSNNRNFHSSIFNIIVRHCSNFFCHHHIIVVVVVIVIITIIITITIIIIIIIIINVVVIVVVVVIVIVIVIVVTVIVIVIVIVIVVICTISAPDKYRLGVDFLQMRFYLMWRQKKTSKIVDGDKPAHIIQLKVLALSWMDLPSFLSSSPLPNPVANYPT